MFNIFLPYNDELTRIAHRKPQRIVARVVCAICHRGDVTLLKREGAYVCGPCYEKLLTLRELEKQQKGQADGAAD